MPVNAPFGAAQLRVKPLALTFGVVVFSGTVIAKLEVQPLSAVAMSW